jgi:hypothetical protein
MVEKDKPELGVCPPNSCELGVCPPNSCPQNSHAGNAGFVFLWIPLGLLAIVVLYFVVALVVGQTRIALDTPYKSNIAGHIFHIPRSYYSIIFSSKNKDQDGNNISSGANLRFYYPDMTSEIEEEKIGEQCHENYLCKNKYFINTLVHEDTKGVAIKIAEKKRDHFLSLRRYPTKDANVFHVNNDQITKKFLSSYVVQGDDREYVLFCTIKMKSQSCKLRAPYSEKIIININIPKNYLSEIEKIARKINNRIKYFEVTGGSNE